MNMYMLNNPWAMLKRDMKEKVLKQALYGLKQEPGA